MRDPGGNAYILTPKPVGTDFAVEEAKQRLETQRAVGQLLQAMTGASVPAPRYLGVADGPESMAKEIEKIRSNPESLKNIDNIYLINHGSPNGDLRIGSSVRVAPLSPEMKKVWAEVAQLNEARRKAGLAPVNIVLGQCFGAACAQRVANATGTKVTGSTTWVATTREGVSKAQPVLDATAGGSVQTFYPRLKFGPPKRERR